MLIDMNIARLLARFPETHPLPAEAVTALRDDPRFRTEIRSAQEAKDAASALKAVLVSHEIPLSRGKTLDLIARMHGHRDWNTARPAFSGIKPNHPVMTMICGPTGSGKTTLMKMMVRDAEERNLPVITISPFRELRCERDLEPAYRNATDKPSVVDLVMRAIGTAALGTTIFVNETTPEAIQAVAMLSADGLRDKDLHIVFDGQTTRDVPEARLIITKIAGAASLARCAESFSPTGTHGRFADLAERMAHLPRETIIIAEPGARKLTLKRVPRGAPGDEISGGWLHLIRPEQPPHLPYPNPQPSPWDDVKTMYMAEDGSVFSQTALDDALRDARVGRKASGITMLAGPVGIGKSTSLLGILNRLRWENSEIRTLNVDPLTAEDLVRLQESFRFRDE